MADCYITNPEIREWYQNQNADRDALQAATLIQTALQIIQLIAFYNLADDAIDNRDRKIDAQWAFIKKLSDYECGPDYEMLQLKATVLTDLELPVVDMCTDAEFCQEEILLDGDAVVGKSAMLAQETCAGIPAGWGVHDGQLFAAQAQANAGSLLANAAKRQQEEFRKKKTDLVTRAQQNMKSLFSSQSILAKYAQATAIYAGLSDLFIQGFNSAGAGLGVSLGILSQSTGTGSSTTFGVGGDASSYALQGTTVGAGTGLV